VGTFLRRYRFRILHRGRFRRASRPFFTATTQHGRADPAQGASSTATLWMAIRPCLHLVRPISPSWNRFNNSDFANRQWWGGPYTPLKRYDPNGLDYLVVSTTDLSAYATKRGLNTVQNLNNMFFNLPGSGRWATRNTGLCTLFGGDLQPLGLRPRPAENTCASPTTRT